MSNGVAGRGLTGTAVSGTCASDDSHRAFLPALPALPAALPAGPALPAPAPPPLALGLILPLPLGLFLPLPWLRLEAAGLLTVGCGSVGGGLAPAASAAAAPSA